MEIKKSNFVNRFLQSLLLFCRLFHGECVSLHTQKTLNVVNQAIPIIKQAKPVINNVKTMFRIMNEFKKVDNKYIITIPLDDDKD